MAEFSNAAEDHVKRRDAISCACGLQCRRGVVKFCRWHERGRDGDVWRPTSLVTVVGAPGALNMGVQTPSLVDDTVIDKGLEDNGERSELGWAWVAAAAASASAATAATP